MFPQVKELIISNLNNKNTKYLFAELKFFRNLETLHLTLKQRLEIKNNPIELKKLCINAYASDPKTTRRIIENATNFTELSLQEASINTELLSTIKFENIQKLHLKNMKRCEPELMLKFKNIIWRYDLKKFKIISTAPYCKEYNELILAYLDQAPHKNLRELTFSIVNEKNVQLNKILKLKNLRKVKFYYSYQFNEDMEHIIAPFLLHYPNVRFELVEYFDTKTLFPTTLNSHYYVNRDSFEKSMIRMHKNIRIFNCKDPYTTYANKKEEEHAKSIIFPPLRPILREISPSEETESNISLENYRYRLRDFSD